MFKHLCNKKRATWQIALIVALTFLIAGQPVALAAEVPTCHAPKFDGLNELKATDSSLVLMANEIFMENESLGGKVAYCLSDAKMTNGKNGLSFGPRQLDLAANREALPILLRILDNPHVRYVSKISPLEDIKRIKAGDLSRRAELIRADPDKSLEALMRKVNSALREPESRSTLNREYAQQLAKDVDDISGVLNNISNRVGSKDLIGSGPFTKLFVLDYKNFFGELTALTSYLNGNSVRIGLPRKTIGPISAPASVSDLFIYVLGTKQGGGSARDERAEVLRRMNTVVSVTTKRQHPFILSEKDNIYFSGEFKTILLSMQSLTGGRSYEELWGLVKLAERK
jgi:hypothetical protein